LGVVGLDFEKKFRTVNSVGEEIVTIDDLRTLLEQRGNKSIVAYDGFEPSGRANIAIGVYRPLILKTLQRAGIEFELLVADSFAWINNKFGGDIEKIRMVGNYFVEVWKAAGVDLSKVKVVWHRELFDDPDYWRKVLLIAKNHALSRTVKSLAIAGRRDSESNPAAFAFYPSMQCADIFHLGVDICQLGLDQRKVNILAREIVQKEGMAKLLGYEDKGANGKPVIVSHHMLLSLGGPKEGVGFDEDPLIDQAISSKMSKSLPNTAIFVHDDDVTIRSKIESAFCPPRAVEDNPIMDYVKEIIFRAIEKFEVLRPSKFGGDVTYTSYPEIEQDYLAGKLHPKDLKDAVVEALVELIRPIRDHFEKNQNAKGLLEEITSYEVTR
jgi:tyrosyl-tRNA synthetase